MSSPHTCQSKGTYHYILLVKVLQHLGVSPLSVKRSVKWLVKNESEVPAHGGKAWITRWREARLLAGFDWLCQGWT